jgi:hypothetical protein
MTKNLDSAIETPDTLTQKVERLERRMSTLELLLNDVMIQLDKPFKNENQFASKQKPNGRRPSNGKAKEKSKQKKETSQVKERILAYLSTETVPKGTRVISQAVRTKLQGTKIALHQLLNSQEIIYIENKGYQRKNPHGERNAKSLQQTPPP